MPLIHGQDDTGNTTPLLVDSEGRLQIGGAVGEAALDAGIQNLNALGYGSNSPTYMAQTLTYTPWATATDFMSFIGSDTKIVIPVFLSYLVHQTSASLQTFYWIKRSTLDTLGTPTNATAVKYDSDNAAATAVLRTYGAAPSGLGTLVGEIGRQTASVAALTSAPTSINLYNITGAPTFSSVHSPFVLRSAAESINLNFGGAAVPAGMTGTVMAVWVEL